jgi:TPR repeat protein
MDKEFGSVSGTERGGAQQLPLVQLLFKKSDNISGHGHRVSNQPRGRVSQLSGMFERKLAEGIPKAGSSSTSAGTKTSGIRERKFSNESKPSPKQAHFLARVFKSIKNALTPSVLRPIVDMQTRLQVKGQGKPAQLRVVIPGSVPSSKRVQTLGTTPQKESSIGAPPTRQPPPTPLEEAEDRGPSSPNRFSGPSDLLRLPPFSELPIEQLSQEALRNNTDAQYEIGVRFYLGNKQVPPDLAAAFKNFSMAAKHGNIFAQEMLGMMYAKGLGVEKNLETAVGWLQKAAKDPMHSGSIRMHLAQAQYDLATLYAGDPQKSERVINLIKYSASNGNAEAQFALGLAYYNGHGVPKDTGQAYILCNKAFSSVVTAANQGNVRAQEQLGLMYEYGLGVKQDWTQAFTFLNKAAQTKAPSTSIIKNLAQAQYQ